MININGLLNGQFPYSPAYLADQIQRELSGIKVDITPRFDPSSLRSAGSAYRQVQLAAAQAQSQAESFASKVGGSFRSLSSLSLAAAPITSITSALRSGITEAAKFDREMTKVAQVSRESSAGIDRLSSTIGGLSTSLGVSSRELASTAVTLKQAGLSLKDTETALGSIARTGLAANFGSISKTVEGAIAVMSQFKLQAKDLEQALGSMNAVAAEFAVEGGDLVTAVQKAGGAFAQTGGNLNELLALFTSVRSTTRESADEIATGLRTILARVQRPQTVEDLKNLRIQLRYTREEARELGDLNLENQFVGSFEAVKRLSEGLRGIRPTDTRYAQIIESLGGYRQISRVIPLLQEFGTAQKALNVAQSGGLSLTVSTEKAQDALLVKVQKLKEEFLEFTRSILENKAFAGLTDDLLRLGSGFLKLIDILKPLTPLIASVGVGKVAFSLGTTARNFSGGLFKGRAMGFSEGGVVPGIGDADSVDIKAMPGEFILRKDVARSIGYETLYEINRDPRARLANKLKDLSLKRGVRVSDLMRPHFASGGVVTRQNNSIENMIKGREFFERIGLPRLDLRRLATRIYSVDPSFLPEDVLGRYQPHSGVILLNHRQDGTSLAHELSHAASRRAAGLSLGGPEVATSMKESPFYRVSKEALEPFFLSMNEDTIRRYLQDYHHRSDLILDESLARGFEGFVRNRRAMAGLGGLSPRASRFYRSRQVRSVFDLIENELLPEWSRITSRETPVVFPDHESYLRSISRKVRGYTRPIERFSKGGPVGGDPGMDANLAYLSKGEFVLSKQAVSRVGVDNLHRMNKGEIPRFASGGFNGPDEELYQKASLIRAKQARRERSKEVTDPLALRENIKNAFSYAEARRILENARPVLSNTQSALLERHVQRQYPGSPGAPSSFKAGISTPFESFLGRALDARGGQQTLSSHSQAQLLLREEERVRREAIQVQAKLVRALTPSVTRLEAMKIATEQVDLALRENAKVIRSTSGRFIGLEQTVEQARKAGLDPNRLAQPGLFSKLSGGIGRGFERFQAYREKRLENVTPARQLLGIAAATSASYAASGLETLAGSADTVGNEGRFRGLRGTSGALSGAVAGGLLGSYVLPGYGTAVGAVIGGLSGLSSALKTASDEIREAKIGKATDTLTERLARLANGSHDAFTLGETSRALGELRAETSARAASEASGLFGFSPSAYVTSRQKLFRDQFGPQLGNASLALQNEAERLVRKSPKSSPGEIYTQLSSNSLNQGLLRAVSEVRQLDHESLRREFLKTIQGFQRGVRLEQTEVSGRTAEERQVTSFTRLISAVQTASDSLFKFKAQSNALGDAFQGTVGPPHVSLGLEQVERLGRFPTSPSLFNLIGSVGDQGKALARSGSAVGTLSSLLPEALSSAASRPLSEADDLTTRFRGELNDLIKSRNVKPTPELGAAVDSVFYRLNADAKNGPGEVLKNIQVDTAGYSEQLLKAFADPVKSAGVEIGRVLEQQAHSLVDGFVKYREQLQTVGQGRDRGAILGAQSTRQALEFAAEDQFRRGAFPFDYSLNQANMPLQFRQERLTGLRGEAANDPSAIGRLLSEAAARSVGLEKRFQDVSRGRENFADVKVYHEALRGVSAQLLESKSKVADYQQALKDLTETTERNAAAQEKLRAIEGDRQGRLGLSEQLFTGGIEGRLRYRRAQSDLNVALRNPAALSALPERAQGVISYLNTAQDVVFPQYGGKTGRDLREHLLTRLAQQTGLGQPQALRDQRDQSRSNITRNDQVAVKAQEELVKFQQNGSKEFFTSLGKNQDEFLKRLSETLTAGSLAELQNRQGQIGRELGEARQLGKERDILARVGVTGDSALSSLRKVFPDVQNLSNAQIKLKDIYNRRKENVAGEAVTGAAKAFGERGVIGLSEYLSGRGFEADQVQKIVENSTRPSYEGETSSYQNLFSPRDYRSAVRGALEQSAESVRSGQISEARSNIEKGGIPSAPLLSAVSTAQGLDQLKKSMDAFGGNSIGGVEGKVKSLQASFESLGKSITDLKAGELTAQGHAMGGSIFKPKGSDVIPAMLSPNEFIVSAKQATKHRALLESINNGSYDGKTIYRAEGGLADYDSLLNADTRNVSDVRRAIADAEEAERGGAFRGVSEEEVNRRHLARERLTQGIGALGDSDILTEPLGSLHGRMLGADAEAAKRNYSTKLTSDYGVSTWPATVARSQPDRFSYGSDTTQYQL